LQQSEDTEKLIALTVKPKEDSTPALPKIEMPKVEAVAEEVEEPKVKVSKKKKVEAPADVDLASLLDEFDD
jgi:hypothetical protein